MRRLIFALLIALFPFACCKHDVEPTFKEEVSFILGTKADDPLNNTIWEYETGDEFNQYLFFERGNVSLFYGCFEDGHLQRWSDFYSSLYLMNGNQLYTAITYPNFGEYEYAQQMDVSIFESAVTIRSGDKVFNHVEADPADLEGIWVIIYVDIVPWK